MGGRGVGKKTFRYNSGKKRAMRGRSSGGGYSSLTSINDVHKTVVILICTVLSLFDFIIIGSVLTKEIDGELLSIVLCVLLLFIALTSIAYFSAYKIFKKNDQ